ncbi:MAG: hypothetical protein ACTSQE_14240 [Candidatus Heimdallarchaeaceae archaeon]
MKFPEALININPKHPKWQERVKIEILNLAKYVQFLQQKGGHSWFFLAPSKDPKFNFMKWEGYLQVATRPEIRFKIVILLPGNYPLACPRAFIEERVVEYAGKIYTKNVWEEPNGERFLMICHDHMKEIDNIWDPRLTIAHFFIREVFYWWAAQQNLIIEHYDKTKSKEE